MNCPNCAQRTVPADLTCPTCGEVLLALPNGTRLYHRYRTLRPLRRTEGISYLAEDEEHQRQVLLLEFFPAGSRRLGTLAVLQEGDAPRKQAWLSQLQQWTGITGEGIQRPQARFEQHGTAYAVAALPLGETLTSRVQSGRLLDPDEAQGMLTSLAGALELLQKQGGGVAHLSPQRVSFAPAGARLDLGWADEAPEAYRSPEQLLSPPRTGPASDVYALASLTVYALTGEIPPTAAQRALGQPLPSLPTNLSPRVRQAIEQGLVLSSRDRISDAVAMRRLLSSTESPRSYSGPATPSTPKVTVIQAHQSWLTHLYTDGQQIVTTGADLRVRVFDERGSVQHQYDGLQGRPTGLASTEMGIVVGDDSGTVTVWGGGHIHPKSHTDRARISQLIGRTGGRAITLQDNGALGAWELRGPLKRGEAPFKLGWIASLHVTALDTLLLGTSGGHVQEFNEHSLVPTALWQHPEFRTITAIASSPSTPDLVAVVTGTQVTVLDRDRMVVTFDIQEPINALTFSPDGDALLMAGRLGGLHYINLQNAHQQRLHRSTSPIRSVSWSASMLVAGNESGQLLILPPPQS